MNKRKEAHHLFSLFIEMLKSQNFDEAEKVFDKKINIYTTHLGNCIGIDEAIHLWKWKGKKVENERYLIFNHVLREDNDKCSESCYVIVQSGYDEETYYHHFNYGGYFSNTYKKDKNNQLKMIEMRYQLDIFEGNTSIVEGWWKPMNPSLYSGYQVPAIISYYDAPWHKVSCLQKYSDEEAICDSIFKYAWGNDHMDSRLLAECIHESFCMDYGSKGIIHGVRSIIEMGLQVRFKEYVMQHIYRIKAIDIQNNEAHVVFYRHEPHRLGSRILTQDNREGIFYSAKYDIRLIKEDNKWKWLSGKYITGIIYDEYVMEDETIKYYF